MDLTAGFVTLASCGLVAVVVPSFIVSRQLWRKRGRSRLIVVLGGSFVAALAWLSFVGTDVPNQVEQAILIWLLFWGVSFYALLGLSGLTAVLSRFCELTRRPSGRLRRR